MKRTARQVFDYAPFSPSPDPENGTGARQTGEKMKTLVMGQPDMKIERQFTRAGQDAYAGIDFVSTTSEIRNPDGTVVFHLDEIEFPRSGARLPAM